MDYIFYPFNEVYQNCLLAFSTSSSSEKLSMIFIYSFQISKNRFLPHIANMPIVVLAGTMDSKGPEYAFIRKKILDNFPDCQVFVIDIAYIQDPDPDIIVPDIRAVEVALKGGCDSIDTLRKGTRADGYKVMTIGLVEIVKNLHSEGKLHGILGLGGTCGSAMLTAAMRALPIGTPKVMVSTMAATETGREYFGISDLTLVNCLTDISGGVNRFNEGTLSNAAVSIASMAIDYYRRCNEATSMKTHDSTNKKLVGISMFGATMPGVTAAQKRLIEHGYDTVIFCAYWYVHFLAVRSIRIHTKKDSNVMII